MSVWARAEPRRLPAGVTTSQHVYDNLRCYDNGSSVNRAEHFSAEDTSDRPTDISSFPSQFRLRIVLFEQNLSEQN